MPIIQAIIESDHPPYLGYEGFKVNYASLSTKVWASEIVTWLSEWRCFVVQSDLVGVQFYDGERQRTLDLDVVHKAIQALGDSPAGYTLDFGVLSTGETALVEMNHGYSLDPYGLDPESYLRVLEAFWLSMTSTLG